ncbi:ABC transporter ATP-binding protein, partial [Lactobacillus sp. XV13L]|nr:ABC transporter ATP-binding protein [Lactobacillus sp. XV13L]
STTINILTGLLKATAGTITYSQNLKIGVVFQNSVLDSSLTVKDNLYLRAKMYQHWSPEWIEELVKLIGIKKFFKQKYGTLSGGQRRRVDIARALVDRPNLLFLDEPTTGLDLQTRLVIWHLLEKLQKEQGLTIFLTTHYLEEAANADQIYVLENGNILASGSASQIIASYAPTKLLIRMRDKCVLKTDYPLRQLGGNQFEVEALDADKAINLLSANRNVIADFDYQKGSINDAFVKITGKELQ